MIRPQPTPIVWRHHGGCALGDSWAIAMFLLRWSELSGTPALVSREFPERDFGAAAIRELLPRICGLLDSPGTIEIREVPNQETRLLSHKDLWNGMRYIRMRNPAHRWDGGSTGAICTQFNGNSAAAFKNPPPTDILRLTAWAGDRAVIPVGLPMTLEESIAAMASCALYMGVCSGMSHVAHSVGCPMLLIEYNQPLAGWHPIDRSWTFAKGTDAAIAAARTMIRPRMPGDQSWKRYVESLPKQPDEFLGFP